MPHAQKVRGRSWPAPPTVSSSMTNPAFVGRCPACLQAQGFNCLEAGSGHEGLQVLDQTGEIPLIISDMRMPELDGMGFLEAVRQRFPDSSVIMLSGMSETTTAVDCLHLGAADFLLKPISLSELQARVARALEKRALVLQNRFYQQHLERQVQEQAQRIQELFLQGVQMLARALEAKDAYTRGHSIRVSRYAVGHRGPARVHGAGLDGIRLGGELHDIGKIGTREAVLHKPGSLTAGGVPPDHRAPGAGRADALTPGARVAGCVCGSCARITSGWTAGISRRSAGREDSDRSAHRRGGGFVRRHDDAAALPGIEARQDAMAELAGWRAPSSTLRRSRPSWPPSPIRGHAVPASSPRTIGVPVSRWPSFSGPWPAGEPVIVGFSLRSSSSTCPPDSRRIVAPSMARISSSSLICIAPRPGSGCSGSGNHEEGDTVVPVLITSCQVSLK